MIKKTILSILISLLSLSAYADCKTSLNSKKKEEIEKVCFCHNVEHNPHTICTDNQGLINGHYAHVNNGTDYLGECVEDPPLDCDDNNECTLDTEVNNECVHTMIDNEICNPPPNCDDSDECTIDALVDNECVYTPNPECVSTDPICGNNLVEEGEECDGTSNCDESCHVIVIIPPEEPPTEQPPLIVPEEPSVPNVEEPCDEPEVKAPSIPSDYLEGSGNGGCGLAYTITVEPYLLLPVLIGLIILFYMRKIRK